MLHPKSIPGRRRETMFEQISALWIFPHVPFLLIFKSAEVLQGRETFQKLEKQKLEAVRGRQAVVIPESLVVFWEAVWAGCTVKPV